MPGPRIDVMLVDDHAVGRMGFRLLIEAAPDMRVVAEAASGEDAVRVVEEARPDVVVMDISMPGIGGVEALGRIPPKAPQAAGGAGRGAASSPRPRRRGCWCSPRTKTRCTPAARSRPGRPAISPSAAPP